MIYEDEKIECEKWRATVTATLYTATSTNPHLPAPLQSSSNVGLPLKTFDLLGSGIS